MPAANARSHSVSIHLRRIVESVWKIVALTLFAPFLSMAFEPPSAELKRAAVGDLTALSPAQQRPFAPDAPEFEPIPKPSPHDWLAVHDEPGQAFDEFKASRPNRPTQERHVIYLQPLGDFAPERSPSIDKLREFAAAFFAMEVKALPPISISVGKFTTRRNPHSGSPQILTSDVLNFLKARLPALYECCDFVVLIDRWLGRKKKKKT